MATTKNTKSKKIEDPKSAEEKMKDILNEQGLWFSKQSIKEILRSVDEFKIGLSNDDRPAKVKADLETLQYDANNLLEAIKTFEDHLDLEGENEEESNQEWRDKKGVVKVIQQEYWERSAATLTLDKTKNIARIFSEKAAHELGKLPRGKRGRNSEVNRDMLIQKLIEILEQETKKKAGYNYQTGETNNVETNEYLSAILNHAGADSVNTALGKTRKRIPKDKRKS
jgi:hypothetical protein